MTNPTPGVDSDVLSENGRGQLLRDDWILVRAPLEHLQEWHEQFRFSFNQHLLRFSRKTYHVLAILFIHLPASVILAVWNGVAGDPLVAAVLSALNLNLRHANWPAKVHLKPLIDVVFFSRPSSCLPIAGPEIQPGVCGAVIGVPLRGGGNPWVGNRSAFHSQRLNDTFWKRKRVANGNR